MLRKTTAVSIGLPTEFQNTSFVVSLATATVRYCYSETHEDLVSAVHEELALPHLVKHSCLHDISDSADCHGVR